MRQEVKAAASLTAAMVIVGSSVPAASIAGSHLPHNVAMELRYLLACLFIVPLCRMREGTLPLPPARDLAVMALQALAGVYGFNLLLLRGLQSTDAASAGIITGTTAAWMAVLSCILFKERPGFLSWSGIGLCVAGVLVVSGGPMDLAGGSLRGDALVLGAVLAESAFLLLRKGMSAPMTALSATTVMSLMGLALFLPGAVWELAASGMPAITPGDWLLLAYYGLVITVAAYLFWFYGVVRLSGAAAGAFTAIMPVSAVLLSALTLGDDITGRHMAGMLCVPAGLALLSLGAGRSGALSGQSSRAPESTDPLSSRSQ